MIRWISVVDLLTFPESRKILVEKDTNGFEELMFDIGFDTKCDIEYQVCLHRPMVYMAANKSPVYTGRWVGTERKDSEWADSHYCTVENKMEIIGTKDIGFQKELVAMSTFPNFTLAMCKHIEDNFGG